MQVNSGSNYEYSGAWVMLSYQPSYKYNTLYFILIRDTEVSDGVKLFITGLAIFTFFIVSAFGCNLRAYLVSYLVSSIEDLGFI